MPVGLAGAPPLSRSWRGTDGERKGIGWLVACMVGEHLFGACGVVGVVVWIMMTCLSVDITVTCYAHDLTLDHCTRSGCGGGVRLSGEKSASNHRGEAARVLTVYLWASRALPPPALPSAPRFEGA